MRNMSLGMIAAGFAVMVSAAPAFAVCENVFYNGRPASSDANELKKHPALKVCCIRLSMSSGNVGGCVISADACGKIPTAKVSPADGLCNKPFPGYDPTK